MNSTLIVNMIIRVLSSLVMFTVSFSYVYSYKNKKFKANGWHYFNGC